MVLTPFLAVPSTLTPETTTYHSLKHKAPLLLGGLEHSARACPWQLDGETWHFNGRTEEPKENKEPEGGLFSLFPTSIISF